MIISHDYITRCIESYNKVFNIPMMPQIFVVYGESAYCGYYALYDFEVRILCIYPDEIARMASYQNISNEQCALETIYHEYIHMIQELSEHAEGLIHGGEVWDNMVMLGIHNKFISREVI